MEEEKAAAYYDELTRKGEGAARFKQGLGFSASNDSAPPPSRGSAFVSASSSSSSSFMSNFVKASSPARTSQLEKQSQLESIQNKRRMMTTSVSLGFRIGTTGEIAGVGGTGRGVQRGRGGRGGEAGARGEIDIERRTGTGIGIGIGTEGREVGPGTGVRRRGGPGGHADLLLERGGGRRRVGVITERIGKWKDRGRSRMAGERWLIIRG